MDMCSGDVCIYQVYWQGGCKFYTLELRPVDALYCCSCRYPLGLFATWHSQTDLHSIQTTRGVDALCCLLRMHTRLAPQLKSNHSHLVSLRTRFVPKLMLISHFNFAPAC